MRIYITRHGQTNFNIERKVCGLSDISLNEVGKSQAQELKQKIIERDLHFDYIFVSPLKRAKETVAPIEQLFSTKAIVDNRLVEFNFGEKEACNFDDPEFRAIRNEPFKQFEGGESMVKAAARVYSFIDYIINSYSPDSTILIVSHATTSKLINSYFVPQSLEEFNLFKVKNCELLEYDF